MLMVHGGAIFLRLLPIYVSVTQVCLCASHPCVPAPDLKALAARQSLGLPGQIRVSTPLPPLQVSPSVGTAGGIRWRRSAVNMTSSRWT